MDKVEKAFQEIKNRATNRTDCYDVMAKILNSMKDSTKIWWFASEFAALHSKD